ncbi:hypothetical protein GXM_04231 [Nostoc sphaeroides CCNUC1]|uniref:Uncharacterized protein n=1 Tax=Nostoc sphaeroides CCNUC1 TaxID=2653204 RepID=A0A5P8W266_9NOSO|nr:hypothetical protein GXM_04231 [Nostoc sphaeroides CCNUC1]
MKPNKFLKMLGFVPQPNLINSNNLRSNQSSFIQSSSSKLFSQLAASL